MDVTPTLDETDRRILALLRDDARRTIRDIADNVGLTVAPVKRRIDRLERAGIIEGYTVRISQSALGAHLEAVILVRVEGNMDLQTILKFTSGTPEVQEVLTIAGDPDALVRVRVESIEELQRVVNLIRTGGRVMGTRTLVVLGRWSRNA